MNKAEAIAELVKWRQTLGKERLSLKQDLETVSRNLNRVYYRRTESPPPVMIFYSTHIDAIHIDPPDVSETVEAWLAKNSDMIKAAASLAQFKRDYEYWLDGVAHQKTYNHLKQRVDEMQLRIDEINTSERELKAYLTPYLRQ